ncbi:MAG: hypothetical protein JW751_21045 [Polyangiaceae bacterium]|nr:hypothetical protein [Polyangiaceae bacterium]
MDGRTPKAAPPLQGVLSELVLSCRGAEYRARAVCVSEREHDSGVAYCFEVEEAPAIVAPARERHGVECLGTALLLDALQLRR